MAFSPFGCGESSGCNPCDGGLPTGPSGLSAYQVAVKFGGFEGTVEEWLASLVGETGESAYQVAVDNGFVGTQAEWLASLVGESAYQIAVDNGFVGTEAEWVESLNGTDGDSGYQVAVANGFVGTEADWLATLVGPQGETSVTGYRYGGFAAADILAGEILIDHIVTQDHRIPANFLGSGADAGTSPAADWVAILSQNGVQIGTLTIDTEGLTTWTTTDGLPIDVVAGDVISLVAPDPADETIARLRYTIEGIVA